MTLDEKLKVRELHTTIVDCAHKLQSMLEDDCTSESVSEDGSCNDATSSPKIGEEDYAPRNRTDAVRHELLCELDFAFGRGYRWLDYINDSDDIVPDKQPLVQKARKIMMMLDWRWATNGGRVPSEQDIEACLRSLIDSIVKSVSEKPDEYRFYSGTGGFAVDVYCPTDKEYNEALHEDGYTPYIDATIRLEIQ